MEPLDQPDANRDEAAPTDRREPEPRWSDVELVAAMRRDERAAFREFFARFAPLVTNLARIWSFPNRDLRERVDEFLDDAAMRLLRPTALLPDDLGPYLAMWFHRQHRNRVRDLRCRERLRDAYAVEVAGGFQRAAVEALSEDSVRTSHGPAWDGCDLSPVMQRLANAVDDGLTDDEWLLLAWLGARVPQRQIAAWLGASHGAIRVRIARLRARVRDAALRHAVTFEGRERMEIDRFLRRAGIEQSVAAVSAGSPRRGVPGKSRKSEGENR